MRDFVRAALVLSLWMFAAEVIPHAVGQELQQPESYLRLHYIKSEHMIPMRDGVKLFTSVFVPRDTTKTYPIMMKRTPYAVGPYGEDKYPARVGPSEHFVKAGYIFVNQDVRGRFASEGEFTQVTPHIPNKSKPTEVDESSDTFDTIEGQAHSTGRQRASREFKARIYANRKLEVAALDAWLAASRLGKSGHKCNAIATYIFADGSPARSLRITRCFPNNRVDPKTGESGAAVLEYTFKYYRSEPLL